VAQARQAVLDEWVRLRQQGVSEDELHVAKSNYAGLQARRFETSRALAGVFGVEALLGRIESFEEALRRLNAVRRQDILRAARTYLDPARYVSVTVGRG
jgi:zinc protease